MKAKIVNNLNSIMLKSKKYKHLLIFIFIIVILVTILYISNFIFNPIFTLDAKEVTEIEILDKPSRLTLSDEIQIFNLKESIGILETNNSILSFFTKDGKKDKEINFSNKISGEIIQVGYLNNYLILLEANVEEVKTDIFRDIVVNTKIHLFSIAKNQILSTEDVEIGYLTRLKDDLVFVEKLGENNKFVFRKISIDNNTLSFESLPLNTFDSVIQSQENLILESYSEDKNEYILYTDLPIEESNKFKIKCTRETLENSNNIKEEEKCGREIVFFEKNFVFFDSHYIRIKSKNHSYYESYEGSNSDIILIDNKIYFLFQGQQGDKYILKELEFHKQFFSWNYFRFDLQ